MRPVIPVLTYSELNIPKQFERLYDLAYNLWWSWDEAASDIWRVLSTELWEQYRNPVEVLKAIDSARWSLLADSETAIDSYQEAVRSFDDYMEAEDTWWDRHRPVRTGRPCRVPFPACAGTGDA